jgi:hypothetical protein
MLKNLSVCEHSSNFAPELRNQDNNFKGIRRMIILNFVAIKIASVVKNKAVSLINK